MQDDPQGVALSRMRFADRALEIKGYTHHAR